MVESMSEYIGKEVIIKSLGVRGRLIEITGAKIEVKTETGECRLFFTDVGPDENAIAKGFVVFVDPSLKEPFLKDYEDYNNTFMGRMDRFADNFFRYD